MRYAYYFSKNKYIVGLLETVRRIIVSVAIFTNLPIALQGAILSGATATAKTETAISTTVPLLKSEYSYRRYTTQDGLPDLNTTTLFQDSKGYLWIGTISRFVRFDGKTFTSFNTNGNGITRFMEDENGDIYAFGIRWKWRVRDDSLKRMAWLATKDNYFYRSSYSLPPNYGLFIIRDSLGIYQIRDTSLVKVWEHPLLENISETHKPYWDIKNKRFFIPTENSLYLAGENGAVIDSFNITTVNCLLPYRNSVWAVADDGLYAYDENNHVFNKMLDYPFFDNISRDYWAVEDKEHNLLIQTSRAMYRYSGNKIDVLISDAMSLWDVYIDREENVWVADASGLYNYFRLNFNNYTFVKTKNIAQSIIADKLNRIWIGTQEGELIRLDGEQQKSIDYPSFSDAGYKYFQRSSFINGNDLYFHSNDIIHYNTNTNKFNRLGLPGLNYVFSAIMPNNRMLAGTINPIAYLYDLKTNKTLRRYVMRDLKQMIFCAVTDKNGDILLGGPEGLSIFSGDSVVKTVFDKRMNFCRNMFYDYKGKLWLTCENRLVSYGNDSVKVEYTFPSTLHNFYITRKGIAIATTVNSLYLSKSSDNLDFVRYDKDNGFNATDVVETNIAEDVSGNVWIPTYDGIICFRPEELLKQQPSPLVVVKSMQLSADNVLWADVSNNKERIKHNTNNVKFNYLGLCFSAAQNVRYHYRLLGFQNSWSEPTALREVTFNNLPPGDYTFEIYADAGTDDSRSETLTCTFSITPALWQRAWFPYALILLAVVVSFLISTYYMKRKNRALFEHLNTERELNDLRIRSIRLKAIPHFNANVLSAIEYYIMNHSREDALRLLGIYSDYTFQTLREVDKASRSLNEELEYVRMYLELEKLRFVDKFDFRFDIQPDVDKNVQLPNMLLHTYCENAVKHGFSTVKEGGLIIIRASQQGSIVAISVEDNGVGRNAASRNSSVPSSKQGLTILNRQIEIYNRFNTEKITQHVEDLYNNASPTGTRFSIEVPFLYRYL